MTWIKICGITNAEDAFTAARAGADALGFVLATSPRQVLPATVRAIVAGLPQSVEKVGVFVDEGQDFVLETVVDAGLTAVQLHGSEPVAYCRELAARLGQLSSPVKLIRAAKIGPLSNGEEGWGWDPVHAGVLEMDPHTADVRPGVFSAILLDSCGSALQAGGTGKAFDWQRSRALAAMIGTWTKLIMAGGLSPVNVRTAVEALHPWGVDVSTGVEREPGKKDPEKVRAFIATVREVERKL